MLHDRLELPSPDYKTGVLPRELIEHNKTGSLFSCYHYTNAKTNSHPGFEPGPSFLQKDYFDCCNEPNGLIKQDTFLTNALPLS